MTAVDPAPARAAFEAYAAMDAPALPAEPWSALQVSLSRWQNRNFPAAPEWQLALGIAEEVGELAEVLTFDWDGTLDAIADITIFAMNLATALRLDWAALVPYPGGCFRPRGALGTVPDVAIWAGLIAHAELKHAQRVRGFDDRSVYETKMAEGLAGLQRTLIAECGAMGVPYFETVSAVAEKVMQRNWRQ